MKIKTKGPYEFDTDPAGIVIFTEKNLKLISAMVNNDSNYRRSFDARCKDTSAGFLNEKFPADEKGMLQAVTLLDKENATHLESTGTKKGSTGGRKNFTEYVMANYKQVRDSIQHGRLDIVEILSKKPIPGRYNISFASKFCTYLNRYCFGGDAFSIVDAVLCKVLPGYEQLYLGPEEIDPKKWVRQKDNKAFDYLSYCKTIQEILDRVEVSKASSRPVTRAEFDLFLWYYYKGTDDRIKKLYEQLP